MVRWWGQQVDCQRGSSHRLVKHVYHLQLGVSNGIPYTSLYPYPLDTPPMTHDSLSGILFDHLESTIWCVQVTGCIGPPTRSASIGPRLPHSPAASIAPDGSRPDRERVDPMPRRGCWVHKPGASCWGVGGVLSRLAYT